MKFLSTIFGIIFALFAIMQLVTSSPMPAEAGCKQSGERVSVTRFVLFQNRTRGY